MTTCHAVSVLIWAFHKHCRSSSLVEYSGSDQYETRLSPLCLISLPLSKYWTIWYLIESNHTRQIVCSTQLGSPSTAIRSGSQWNTSQILHALFLFLLCRPFNRDPTSWSAPVNLSSLSTCIDDVAGFKHLKRLQLITAKTRDHVVRQQPPQRSAATTAGTDLAIPSTSQLPTSACGRTLNGLQLLQWSRFSSILRLIWNMGMLLLLGCCSCCNLF
jgi:hypothetical protein